MMSSAAVSEMGERLWVDYQEFSKRDLSEADIAHLFIDGIAERIRPGHGRKQLPGDDVAGEVVERTNPSR